MFCFGRDLVEGTIDDKSDPLKRIMFSRVECHPSGASVQILEWIRGESSNLGGSSVHIF